MKEKWETRDGQREGDWKNSRIWAGGHKSFHNLETPRKQLLRHSPWRACLVLVPCFQNLHLTMCSFKFLTKQWFAMGMNRGASEPRAPLPLTHRLPDCDCRTTEGHLFFMPELPQVAHSNPSPLALKTSQIGQISCVNPLESQYAWELQLYSQESSLFFLIQNFPHTVDHINHHISIYINIVCSSRYLWLC